MAKRKHRGLRVFITLIIIAAVLAIAFVVGDHYARAYATGYIRDRVTEALGLKSSKPVSVDVGTGSIILQAVQGRLDDVHVRVSPLTVEGVTGTATVAAKGVPLNSDQAVRALTIRLTVPAASLSSKLKSIPQLKGLDPKISVSGSHVDVTGKAVVFGLSIPLGLELTPGVTKGKPTFTLNSIRVNGTSVPAATLDRVVPGFTERVKSGTSICIASALPADFTLTGVSLEGSSLSYVLTGNGVKLNDASLSRKGTCPAQ